MSKEKSLNKIPDSWIWCSIGDIGIVTSGGTPSTRNPAFWDENTPWVTPSDLSGYNEKFISQGKRSISNEGLENSSARLLPKGSILFSSRAPIGYTVIAKNELATNQGFKNIISTRFLNSEFVYYYFKTLKSKAEEVASGTTFLELSASKFSQLPFPLAPLKEQEKIVSKIETLFSELDQAENGLHKAKQQLIVYKQALLKSVFVCESTNQLKDYTELITKGSSPKWQGINYTLDEEEILFVTSENVQNNFIDFVKKKFVERKFNEKQKRSILKNGDILLNIVGASIGRAAVFNIDTIANINQAVSLIRLKKDIEPKIISYFLNSPIANEYYQSRMVDVARANLSLKDISEIPIPIIIFDKQLDILAELESRFTLIDNLEKSIKKSLIDIIVFRHSILKKAFEGKLVSQESNDESAFELLQKIQIEKIAYLKAQKDSDNLKPKKKRKMETKKTVLAILKESVTPISIQELWANSIYEGDIEGFYSEIKEIYSNLIEVKNDTESFLSLKK